MSLRQLCTRIEHLEAKSPEPVNNVERAARAHWGELRLMRWKQANLPNEVEKPLTREEEAELTELTYRFDPLWPAAKACEEAAEKYAKSVQEKYAKSVQMSRSLTKRS